MLIAECFTHRVYRILFTFTTAMYKACSVPILTENDKNCPLNKKHENDEAPPLDLPFTSLKKKKNFNISKFTKQKIT